jgi:hypothetical protein
MTEEKTLCVKLGDLLTDYCWSQDIEYGEIKNKALDKNTEICFTYNLVGEE